MTVLCASSGRASLPEALSAGAVLLEAVRDGTPRAAAFVVDGPAVVLGVRQRAGRVVDLAACRSAGVTVLRRATTGAAAYVGGAGVVWALALPAVSSLVPDATLGTLLNRNVRLLLAGLLRAGAQAAYFGREWIAVRHRPAVALGYDVTRDGRVLIEAIAGWDAPIGLPRELSAERERVLDRWRGKAPVALADCVGEGWSADALARMVIERIAERAGVEAQWEAPVAVEAMAVVTDDNDPMPPGASARAPVAAPIGYVEAAVGEGSGWLGGDMLAATWWLDDVASAFARGEQAPEGGPLEGARAEDLQRAWNLL